MQCGSSSRQGRPPWIKNTAPLSAPLFHRHPTPSNPPTYAATSDTNTEGPRPLDMTCPSRLFRQTPAVFLLPFVLRLLFIIHTHHAISISPFVSHSLTHTLVYHVTLNGVFFFGARPRTLPSPHIHTSCCLFVCLLFFSCPRTPLLVSYLPQPLPRRCCSCIVGMVIIDVGFFCWLKILSRV